MPLYRIARTLSIRSVKLNLNSVQIFQYVIFKRECSTEDYNQIKGWIFQDKRKDISFKALNLAFTSVMADTLKYEKDLLRELLDELNLSTIVGTELKYFLSRDISYFRHVGIELDRGELTKNLVQHLEPFPLDMTPIYSYSKCKRIRISIKTILMVLEAQYLAYRLNIDLPVIITYFKEMKNCFFHYKSLRSTKRNLDVLLGDKICKQMSVSNIIFFLNSLRPFSLNQLRHVEKDLLGISWGRLPSVCPRLVRHSYCGIMFRIRMLRDMGFTDKQIQFGLPYLGVLVPNIYSNIKYMLSKFGSFKEDEFFLKLLRDCYSQKKGLAGVSWKSYEAIQKEILLKEKKRMSLANSRTIICLLQEKLGMTTVEWKILREHPAVIVEERVLETLKLLEEKHFSKADILESISIILYPKYIIEKNLKKISEDAEKLRKFGFEDGCVDKVTHYFKKGTKLKQKTLQLCLYYIEKSIYVSKDIVLDFDDANEATELREVRD